jgi:hypothetical protein
MAPTTQTKAVTASSSNPLRNSGILNHILSFAGPGHWLFLGAVSSFWRDVYATLASIQVVGCDANRHERNITCLPQMTLYSSMLSSPARVRHAVNCGFEWMMSQQFMFAAGRYADISTLMAANALGMAYTATTMSGAARTGALETVQWLYEERFCGLCKEHTIYAAMSGSVQVLCWTREKGVPFTKQSCEFAACYGQLPALQYLRAANCSWDNHHILEHAASSGSLELTAWVKQQIGVVASALAMYAAAGRGHTAVCQYLRSERCAWNDSVCSAAAQGGHVSTLHWLREHGCPCDANKVCTAAAAGGSVAVMQYLQQQGLLTTAAQLSEMLNAAGAWKKIEAAQWLRQQNAAWPNVLIYQGRFRWSTDMIKWARQQGCTSADTEIL